MTKLYYTDPLAAAYMAREFGVILQYKEQQRDKEGQWHVPDVVHSFEWSAKKVTHLQIKQFAHKPYAGMRNKIHIHPDSLHIFEPMEGDMDEDGFIYGMGNKWWREDLSFHEAGGKFHTKLESEIAKRNGKAFFMPEKG